MNPTLKNFSILALVSICNFVMACAFSTPTLF